MAEIKITSHDQKGGITAHTVSESPEQPPAESPRGRALRVVVGIATIVGTLIAVAALWVMLRK